MELMASCIQLSPSRCFLGHKLPNNSYSFSPWQTIHIATKQYHCFLSYKLPNNSFSPPKWQTIHVATKQYHQQCRSANQLPSYWNYELLESNIGEQNYHVEEGIIKKIEEEIRCKLENEGAVEPLALLELIDDIQRLGIGHRFQESTNIALNRITLLSQHSSPRDHNMSLHACALYFRLLRQQGYHVSADIFERFKDSNEEYMTSLADDIQGMLSLYEASYLGFDGETILDEAREFTSFHLKKFMIEQKMDKKSGMRVSHALELPFHHRVQRLEARWNIEMYDDNKPKTLHQLAILDFNMVQSVHQRDLQEVSRWWRDVGLANKLSFARDRLLESFFWTVGMVFEPKYSKCRVGLTKVVNLVTVLDDIYDINGSPQELQQLTEAVDKWDVNYALSHLPDYMKLFFFALYNTVNDTAYDVLKEQNQVIISHLRKVWADLCKAFLKEAQWSCNRHIPKQDEYMNNAWISSTGAVLLTHAYFLITQPITEEAINQFNGCRDLLRLPSTIFRLANDATSDEDDTERGIVVDAVSCYMHETGMPDEVARAHIRKRIDQNWKEMNREVTCNYHLDKCFTRIAANLARISLCQYQYGDAHTNPSDVSTNRIKSVIIEPIRFANFENLTY